MPNDNKSLAHTRWNCKCHIYRICAEVPEESILRREARGDRGDTEAAVRVERGGDRRSGNLPGSRAYAGEYPAKGSGIELHGVPERKE